MANELGAGNVGKAKSAAKVTLKLSVVLALFIILFFTFGHDIWASFFSSRPLIITEFAKMTPLLSISIVLDSAQGILSGNGSSRLPEKYFLLKI